MIRKFALVATAAALMVACGGAEETMDNATEKMDSTANNMMEKVEETATTAADKMDSTAGAVVDTLKAAAETAAPAAH